MDVELLKKELYLQKELAKLKARRDFKTFVGYTMPTYEFNWHHEYLIDKLQQFAEGKIKKLMVFMPPQHGKQIVDNQPVITKDGWKTHGELKVGDYVFHPSGRQIKVLSEIPQVEKCNVEIEFSNGEKIICHRNHEWTVIKNRQKEITVEAKYFLKNKLWTGVKSKRGSRYIYQLPFTDCLEIERKETTINPYCLGAWLGDGKTTSPSIYGGKGKVEVLNYFSSLYEISHSDTHKVTGVVKNAYHRTEFHEGLKKEGLLGNKHIPENYIMTCKADRLQLLAGLIDTDGSLHKGSGQYRFTNTNRRLIKDVCFLLSTLGYTYSVTCAEPRDMPNSYGIQDREQCYQIGFTPLDEIPCKVERKMSTKRPLRRRVSIVGVRVLKKGLSGKCIEVDSDDGLYLVGRMMVATHNSQLVSRHLHGFLLGLNPNIKIASCSYNSTFASKFNRDVKRIIKAPEYKEIFPNTRINEIRRRDEDAINNAEEFEVVGHTGSYKSVGIGGALTGNPVDIGSIDDPIKDKAEANSETYRDRLWDWYETVFESRLHNESQQLVTLTRWHHDDLAGRILERDGEGAWVIVKFPAIKTDPTDMNDPRQVGEALWPGKHSLERMEKIKEQSREVFNSLYQQDPTAEGGNIIKEDWFKYTEALPRHLTTDVWIDGAYTNKSTNDPTGVMATKYDHKRNTLYVFDTKFVRMELPDLLNFLPKYFRKVNTTTKSKAYVEPKASGLSIRQMGNDKRMGCQFVDITTKLVGEGKTSRAQVAAAAFEAGNVVFYRSGDQSEMENQLIKFPSYGNDEAVDMLGYACDYYFGVKRRGPKRRN